MVETLSELDRLIAEQKYDDTETIRPEFPGQQVPFTDGLANCIGVEIDGEIVTHWPRPPKGTLLVGAATWHGTYGGYTRRGCRCVPCTEANTEYRRQRRLNGDS